MTYLHKVKSFVFANTIFQILNFNKFISQDIG